MNDTYELTNEQTQHIVRELRRHLVDGARIFATCSEVFAPRTDGTVWAGIHIEYTKYAPPKEQT